MAERRRGGVTATHRGVRPGLAEAINDVRRARTRVGGLRGAPVDVMASEVSLRRAGVLDPLGTDDSGEREAE